jgi:hypothetical protein
LAHYADDGTGSDWSPLRRVVGVLAARDYAPAFFAYTTMDVFCITFQPAYHHGFGSDSVGLAFDSSKQLFQVSYVGFGRQVRAKWRCEEFEVGRLVDALALRMKLASSE